MHGLLALPAALHPRRKLSAEPCTRLHHCLEAENRTRTYASVVRHVRDEFGLTTRLTTRKSALSV